MAVIPSEIVADILSRLPVKPLLRFRCVSKPWCALIDSPDFIKTHLNRSIQTNTNLTLILRDSIDPNLRSIDFDSLDKTVNLDHPLKTHNHNTRLWGSSNGLLCLSNSEKDVILWNPSTKRHWKLPFAPIEVTTPPSVYVSKVVVFGLGLDKVSDDYKVVRVVLLHDAKDNYVRSEVRVYSLKSNSWNRVRDFPCYLYLSDTPGLLASGAFHWVVTESHRRLDDDDLVVRIIRFDLGTERFHQLHPPAYRNLELQMNIGVLEGSLCVICSYYNVCTDIWVMKEYGVKESWTKLVLVKHSNLVKWAAPKNWPFDVLEPIAYSKNGGKVLCLHNAQRFFWYDLDRMTVEEVRLRGKPDDFDVKVCLGSLVPPGSGGGVSDGKKPAAQDDRKKKTSTKKSDGFLSEGFKLKL